mmetsp:Transcript_59144/g.183471  ORF Transcript_59144/g.183471 Transcript_59144/m.183471 type:complete len:289 (-) Transcript_59144:11-877(-)
MTSTPWSSARKTSREPLQCAATRLRLACASWQAALTSSAVYVVRMSSFSSVIRLVGTKSPPMLILIVSTPSLMQRRTFWRTSSGPSATRPKESRCWCMAEKSPRQPVEQISGEAASKRGPGARPALIQFRATTSRRGRAAAALNALVNPAWSSLPQFSTVVSAPSSGGRSPVSVPSTTASKLACACPSMRPGMTAQPPQSMMLQPPGTSLGSAVGNTACTVLPFRSTLPGNAGRHGDWPSGSTSPVHTMQPFRSVSRSLGTAGFRWLSAAAALLAAEPRSMPRADPSP